ncbi:MAG: TolC family protein [Deltaproteobacteria bacterium]|nr:TolC family protein [Deltaproteobacteria bacterium]
MTRLTLVRGTALALLLTAFACLSALAGPLPRSINEIVALALKHSAELAALEKEAAAKHSLAAQAGTFSNPTLELQGVTGALTGSPEERSFSIGVNQEFSLNGKLRMRREVGQREAEVVQRQRDNTARLLKDEVATLALELVLADKRRELATGQVTLNQELVRISDERFKAGDIPELELNLAKVELARAESRLFEVERERIPLRIKIASLTGLKEYDINLSDKLSASIPTPKTQDLVNQALTSRPDLLALALERDKAETEKSLAKAEALPNLTVGLFAEWQRGSTEVGGMSSTGSDTQLGLRLSMPIPLFDRNQGGRAAARARLDAAGSRRLALERSIIAEVEAAVSRLSSSEKILEQFEKGIIPQLTENLKLTQEAYRIGEVGILSVIDEQKKFFEVNDDYLSALHGRGVAFIKLETAVATDFTGGAQ